MNAMRSLQRALSPRQWPPSYLGFRPLSHLQQELHHHPSSTATQKQSCPLSSMAVSPARSPPPAGAAAAPNLLVGRADAVGTSQYAQKLGSSAGPGHFRTFPVGGAVGDLVVSSLGLGTYLGPDSDAADKEYQEAILRALSLGVNVIDSASNYRNMRSERAVGDALSNAISRGLLKRNEVVVCTKGGFLSFDYKESIEPRTYIEDTYVKTGLFQWSEFVGGCHCISAPYLKNQMNISRRNLGLETIDVYFVHNPETQLGAISRQQLSSRLRDAFVALEECCAEGKISVYGVATWNGFRVASGAKNHLSLEELVNMAKDVGGEAHHFKVVQLPYNLTLQEAATTATQTVKGRRMPLLHAAHQLGVSVIASATLNQASLCKGLASDVREKFPELGQQRTDGQCALQFVRKTPGIMTGLAGMRRVAHVEENAAVIGCPGNTR